MSASVSRLAGAATTVLAVLGALHVPAPAAAGPAADPAAVAAAPEWQVVHYQRPDGDYDGWNLYAFGDIDESARTTFPAGQPFAGADAYGRFAWVKLKPGARHVGYLVVHEDGVRDVEADRFVDPAVHPEIWLKQGDPAVVTRRPDLPRNFEVPLAAGATGLNYILHRGDTKDLPDDQRLDFATAGREVWLLAGQPRRLVPPVRTAGTTGEIDLTRSRAVWLDRGTLAWQVPGTGGEVYDLVYAPAGGVAVVDGELSGAYRSLRLHADRTGLTAAQRARFPHLSQYPAFRLGERDQHRVPEVLRGQVLVTERDADGRLRSATGVQTAGVLDDVYAAATSATLGPVFAAGRPRLAVWAPTAQTVALEVSDRPGAAATTVALTRDDRTGVWSVTGPPDWTGKYYRYRVTAWQPAARKVVTASVTDPYSLALSADSTHSQIVDLSSAALRPAGWDTLRKPAAVAPARIQISELSVRDFSIADRTVPPAERGTYAAFSRTGSAGMRHLRSLAGSGVTHLHLLPVFDFATIPERRADQQQPACDLPALPPDSAEQQRCVAAVAASDGYNWGYDPLHYTVPEGGYAVDPDGAARTTEFRRMVAGLNNAGLRVVLDVVYNHTSASGTDPKSVLDQVVPGYYHRLLDDGTVATSTCCANTAPEHAMMGKLVVDSVVTWAKAYRVDGFRFDLMGHHPKANLLDVRRALDRLTPARDGVDGRNIYVYGEGWNFGEVADDARFEQATQANLAGTGIGTFNDRLRDAVRGGGPFDDNPRVQGFGSGLFTDPNGDPVNGTAAEQRARLLHHHDQIKVGLSGNLARYRFTATSGTEVTGADIDYNGSPAGYNAAPGEAVTYVDAHDNEILFDALAYKLPPATPAADRARMQTVALATTALGQGPGFVTTGSERLRSKSLDRNSFNSGDWFNAIQWDCADGNGFGRGLPPAPDNEAKWPYARPLLADPELVPDCGTVETAQARYTELLRVRRSSPVFGLPTAAEVQRRLTFPLSGTAETPGVLTMRLDGRGLDPRWSSVTVVYNATPSAATQTVPAARGRTVELHPVLRGSADPVVRTASFDTGTGTFTVPARTVAVFVQK
ncbi:pullulanase-type alpha-1,6-glucosidase [Jidongwangia harbinensis]|uniref:pullulanase-type alpha-1,6-glucosidase n=1 Tax=Jidongwangia harbinensis TaxID=2878561 RepID=UPI001CD9FB91|nr:pullulanase-type alpha-1,6-glucosidase [Jidongwangia harbinensis]MCA2216482.1 pullulanase-type alpha-1,6-glucosidase [Jidongwangia harbinensis]